jgi:hypothetical protein
MIDRHQSRESLGLVTIDRLYELSENLDRVHCGELIGSLPHRSKAGSKKKNGSGSSIHSLFL